MCASSLLCLCFLVPDAQADGEQEQHHAGPDQHVGHREGLALKDAASYLCLVPLSSRLAVLNPGTRFHMAMMILGDQYPQADGGQRIVCE